MDDDGKCTQARYMYMYIGLITNEIMIPVQQGLLLNYLYKYK